MGLREYIVRRILQLVFTLWAFVTLLFVLFRMVPGDPTTRFVMEYPTPEAREQRIEELGLNEPLYVQYFEYLGQLLRGEFGDSTHYREPVSELIFPLFLNTVVLMFTALIIAYTFGVLFGAAMGWLRGSRFERGGIVLTLVARSSPEFWIGVILVWIFVFQLGVLPRSGIGAHGGELTMNVVDRYANVDFLRHLILPALTGAIYYMATPALLMRNTMLEVLKADFIEIKKAEGLPERTVLYKHAARNSVLPLVTVVAIATGAAMGGSVIIETVFNWPGIGREMVASVTRNDYPVAMAAFFLMGTAVIVMNFVADLAYLYLDPRVKYE
ncbi:ABC transporter permease [Natrarchaeobaculum sulfurireducens]|uniref:ABC-type dipeptide/oligopeptide/nickel transportsystem, permease component n=1 Tax=Natrarchaeobaculum sulfurireducens TaxID=2044521 RepID=A0A346PI16_9EURY|nr:ABC transporter permease [Natrarchaeobaculum sulfurireducens]AXR79161.1 ABC-type dipeptide/oligopeptide/nickel transportsystem, permease component [Natrarchaeobaculum sulfurireducens]